MAGASVQYLAARTPDGVIDRDRAVVASRDDGSFEIVVLPGKGHLFVFGPTRRLRPRGDRRAHALPERPRPGGQRHYAPQDHPVRRQARRPPRRDRRRAPARAGRSRAASSARTGRRSPTPGSSPRSTSTTSTSSGGATSAAHARDGRFELHGLDPERPVRVAFLDSDHQWGAVGRALGQAGRRGDHGPAPAVRPGDGPARRARRQAHRGASPSSRSWAAPGPAQDIPRPAEQAELAADTVVHAQHRSRLPPADRPRTDADGRITLPDLIPGATYRISGSYLNVPTKRDPVYKDFTVKPGETLDLGDIPIERPPG